MVSASMSSMQTRFSHPSRGSMAEAANTREQEWALPSAGRSPSGMAGASRPGALRDRGQRLLSHCPRTNLIRRDKQTWEGSKAYGNPLSRPLSPLPSGTCQPALCAIKAAMLSLPTGLTISIDNPASSGDNIIKTCSSIPGIRSLRSCSER